MGHSSTIAPRPSTAELLPASRTRWVPRRRKAPRSGESLGIRAVGPSATVASLRDWGRSGVGSVRASLTRQSEKGGVGWSRPFFFDAAGPPARGGAMPEPNQDPSPGGQALVDVVSAQHLCGTRSWGEAPSPDGIGRRIRIGSGRVGGRSRPLQGTGPGGPVDRSAPSPDRSAPSPDRSQPERQAF